GLPGTGTARRDELRGVERAAGGGIPDSGAGAGGGESCWAAGREMKMASTTQDELYRALLAVSGQQTPALGDANAMLADVIAQLREVPSSVPTAAPASNTPTTTTSQDSGSTDRALLAVSGQQTPAIGDATAMLADVIAQIGELRSSSPTPLAASKTQTTAQTTSNDSGSTLGSVASTVLTSGFGLAPLISGLVSLFSGGDAAAPPPLV